MWPFILLLIGVAIAGWGYWTARSADWYELVGHIVVMGAGGVIALAGIIWAFLS